MGILFFSNLPFKKSRLPFGYYHSGWLWHLAHGFLKLKSNFMVWVIISILSVSVVLIISAPLTNSSKNSRLLIVSFFLGFSGLSIFTYNLISYPSYKEFESNTSKRINPKSLSTSSTAPAEEQIEEILKKEYDSL